MQFPFSTADLTLARRTEAAEAANGFALVGKARPGSLEAIPVAGGCAVFAGVGSPMTHALGIGMAGSVSSEEFDRMEEFFRSRGSASLIDLCPLADASVVEQVMGRGYRIIEFNNLMLRPVDSSNADYVVPAPLGVTVTAGDRYAEWCRLVMRGFGGVVDMPEDAVEVLMNMTSVGDSFFGEIAGEPKGAAAMAIHNRMAMLFGDSTLAEARGQGLQTALIRHRVALAARAGCDYAMACVVPGTASHRNYERCGFRLFYMRVNVQRDLD
ncbi:MAG: GNAT family N-acetyltransferase [Acidobacteria bacterium]|nr:GNAT family N-acetyltransferase [Acidobacteriota bacterium]